MRILDGIKLDNGVTSAQASGDYSSIWALCQVKKQRSYNTVNQVRKIMLKRILLATSKLVVASVAPLALLAGCGGGGTGADSTAQLAGAEIAAEKPDWAWMKTGESEREQPNIYGGTASTAPWVVNVSGACSGVAINESWILTAAHCPKTGVTITFRDGTTRTVNKVIASPTSDIQVQHLSKPYALTAYPEIDLNYSPPPGVPTWKYTSAPGEPATYTPNPGDAGTILGLGQPSFGEFRQARVTAVGTSTDTVGGPSIVVDGVDGSALFGDSGGPILVNGKLVGVCSSGATITPLNIKSRSFYANLRGAKDLIKSVMVSQPIFQNGLAQIEIGQEYLSNEQLVFWKNGTWMGMSFYGNSTSINATATSTGVKYSIPAQPGDYVAAGLVYTPAQNATQAEVRIASALIGGIFSVDMSNSLPQVEMSTWLFQSNQRVMFMVNGKYVGESYAGVPYYTPGWWSTNGVTLQIPQAMNNGDVLEAWIVPGVPGNTPPTSSTKVLAKALYWKSI